MEIAFEPKQKYILVHVTGGVDLEQSKTLFVRLLGICADQKLFRVIVDYRETTGYLTIFDRLNYLDGVNALYKAYLNMDMPKIRIAYLAPIKLDITESAVLDRRNELAFDNTATHDIETAEQWVMKY